MYCSLAPLLLLLLLSPSLRLLILPSHDSTFIIFVCACSTLQFIPCVCPLSLTIILWFRSFVVLNTLWNNIHACFNICTGDRTPDGKKCKYATTAVAGQDIIDVRPLCKLLLFFVRANISCSIHVAVHTQMFFCCLSAYVCCASSAFSHVSPCPFE